MSHSWFFSFTDFLLQTTSSCCWLHLQMYPRSIYAFCIYCYFPIHHHLTWMTTWFPSGPWHFRSCFLQSTYHTAVRLMLLKYKSYHVILWFKGFRCLWISFRTNPSSLPRSIKPESCPVYLPDFVSCYSPPHSLLFSYTELLIVWVFSLIIVPTLGPLHLLLALTRTLFSQI